MQNYFHGIMCFCTQTSLIALIFLQLGWVIVEIIFEKEKHPIYSTLNYRK